MRIKTVGELIERLQQYPPSAPVLGTWESIFRVLDVYASANGVVLVDADRNDYREIHQKAEVDVGFVHDVLDCEGEPDWDKYPDVRKDSTS